MFAASPPLMLPRQIVPRVDLVVRKIGRPWAREASGIRSFGPRAVPALGGVARVAPDSGDDPNQLADNSRGHRWKHP